MINEHAFCLGIQSAATDFELKVNAPDAQLVEAFEAEGLRRRCKLFAN